jgi:hypothetical protein
MFPVIVFSEFRFRICIFVPESVVRRRPGKIGVNFVRLSTATGIVDRSPETAIR